MKTLLASACMAFALATSRRSAMRTSVWKLKSHSSTSGSRPTATETGQLHLKPTLSSATWLWALEQRIVRLALGDYVLFELSEGGTQDDPISRARKG
jgi:hypothetical protein